MALDPSLDQQLVPIYGQSKATQIRNYLAEFQPYKSNFAPQTPTFREAGGRKLLLITCPLQITPKGRPAPVVLNVGLLFTMQFPDSPPHCAVMLSPGERLVQDHPLVAASGVVRLPLLPYLQELTTPASLMDLLLACTAAFEEQFPVDLSSTLDNGNGAPPPPPVTNQPPPAGRHVDPTAPPTSPPVRNGASSPATTSGSAAAPPNPSSQPTHTTGMMRANEKELQGKVILELRMKGEDHLKFKMESLTHLQMLKDHIKQQQEAEQVLAERKQILETTGPKMHEISELVGKWKSNNDMSSADACIVPQDDLHGQMIEVLAMNHAADDCMELLEKRLKKGLISCDDYLKSVQELSRRQFISKLLLKRIVARMDADANSRALHKKFPNFDPQMISEMLKTSDFDVEAAETRLQELQ